MFLDLLFLFFELYLLALDLYLKDLYIFPFLIHYFFFFVILSGAFIENTGAIFNAGHISQIDGASLVNADHQLAHFLRVLQKRPALDDHLPVVAVVGSGRHRHVGALQHLVDFQRRHVVGGHALGIEPDGNLSGAPPDDVGAPRVLDRLQLDTDLFRHPSQLEIVALFAKCDSPVAFFLLALLAIVLAPIGEELVFRAGFFRFMKPFAGTIGSMLASALLFALLHGNTGSFLTLTAVGVCLCLAYEMTGDIKVPIFFHSFFNLNAIFLILLQPNAF